MKKIISAVMVCMLVFGTLLTLASCKDSEDGTYVSGTGTEVVISGKNYTVNATDTQEKMEYTFEVKDSTKNAGEKEIHLTVKSGDGAGKTFAYTYEKIDGGFVINGQKYTKK